MESSTGVVGSIKAETSHYALRAQILRSVPPKLNRPTFAKISVGNMLGGNLDFMYSHRGEHIHDMDEIAHNNVFIGRDRYFLIVAQMGVVQPFAKFSSGAF